MDDEYINLTPENLPFEHLSCIIRQKKAHPGVEEKRKWLAERLTEGHVFRKLNAPYPAFIEYAPLETAWVPLEGDNYIYIYCLWVNGEGKGHGHGKALMEYCINDAAAKYKSGICMLSAEKQKNWLSDRSFAEKYGFKTADRVYDGYELLSLSFDGTFPRFTNSAKSGVIESKELTVYYGAQCPYIYHVVETIKKFCLDNELPVNFISVDTLEKAKALPCVFNNFAIFCGGRFQTVNLPDTAMLKRMTGK